MGWLINSYNKRSSKKYGWHPSWFNSSLQEINTDLELAVRMFQQKNDLEVDGKVGPQTFRRILSERDLDNGDSYILIDGEQVDVDCKVKIDLLPKNCYRTWRRKRKPNMIVTHWDATTSAEKCKRVLQARKISSHFCIDNDGTIYQYVDTNHTAWHAGKVNKNSIGVDFTNAYYMKYSNYYKKNHGERPVCRDSVIHGVKLKPHLGYYPEQLKAYKKLIKVLCKHYGIMLQTPPVDEVYELAADGKYDGIVCHYHLTRNKIDCAGLPLKKIIAEMRIPPSRNVIDILRNES